MIGTKDQESDTIFDIKQEIDSRLLNPQPITDLKRFIDLYTNLGIRPIVSTIDDGTQIIILSTEKFDNDVTTSECFNGYPYYFTEIHFDPQGKFIGQSFKNKS